MQNQRELIVRTERDRDRAVSILRQLPIQRPLSVLITDYRERRTNTQNARLWALHTLAASVVGCSPAEMHEEALCEFFGYHEVEIVSRTGEIHYRRVPRERSSVQDRKRFMEFMEATENWYISTLGVFLP